ncbi:hypothetical protein MLD38_030220 [Melastoma candidum]|uniref:Uncharacterized protein n=1 Tax=Melastoma candidum TaxID=119954 RepID=A0ACB9MKL5_9MYRT|nr:hypothetical protein MLD38_030220 [Melastoma candidum]
MEHGFLNTGFGEAKLYSSPMAGGSSLVAFSSFPSSNKVSESGGTAEETGFGKAGGGGFLHFEVRAFNIGKGEHKHLSPPFDCAFSTP